MLGYHNVKTWSLYLTWPWIRTGSWQTDGQTDRIPIANTRSQQYLPVQLWRVKIRTPILLGLYCVHVLANSKFSHISVLAKLEQQPGDSVVKTCWQQIHYSKTPTT